MSQEEIVWFKAWTETRRYFQMGTTVLIAMVLALYFSYPGEPGKEFPHGALAVGLDQVRTLPHDAHSYIWLHWFGNTLLIWLSFLAVALASAGVGPSTGASGLLYTLSMPVTRRRLATVRMTLGLLEITVVAFVSSLLVCALAPLVGQSFPVGESLVHALLAVAGVASFYGLLVFLSATLGDLHKAIVGIAVLFLYGIFTFLAAGFQTYSFLRLMSGDMYFLRGEIPWAGIAASLGVGLVLASLALLVVERRDY